MRQNIINGNGKRIMDKPLDLPDRPRPTIINFNMACNRRSCTVGFDGGLETTKTTIIPPIDTPSPSKEFSRLDISLAATQQAPLIQQSPQMSLEEVKFYENPMFGKSQPLETFVDDSKSLQNCSSIYTSSCTGAVNPMFNAALDFTTKSLPILSQQQKHKDSKAEESKKTNKNIFLRHILPEKCFENCAPKQLIGLPNKKIKKFKKLHCGNGFLNLDTNPHFKCRLATKFRILPTVMDSNDETSETSVSNSSSISANIEKAQNKEDDDDEERRFYEAADNNVENAIKLFERSRETNCISQISDSQESGYVEDFNASSEESSSTTTHNLYEEKIEPV